MSDIDLFGLWSGSALAKRSQAPDLREWFETLPLHGKVQGRNVPSVMTYKAVDTLELVKRRGETSYESDLWTFN
jgi:hypothetical protein